MSASPPKGIAAAQFGINAAVARMAAAAAVVKRKRHMSSSLVGGFACQMEKSGVRNHLQPALIILIRG